MRARAMSGASADGVHNRSLAGFLEAVQPLFHIRRSHLWEPSITEARAAANVIPPRG
jgi:hypothetical protein